MARPGTDRLSGALTESLVALFHLCDFCHVPRRALTARPTEICDLVERGTRLDVIGSLGCLLSPHSPSKGLEKLPYSVADFHLKPPEYVAYGPPEQRLWRSSSRRSRHSDRSSVKGSSLASTRVRLGRHRIFDLPEGQGSKHQDGASMLVILVLAVLIGTILAVCAPIYADYQAQRSLDAWIVAFGAVLEDTRDEARKSGRRLVLRPVLRPEAANPWGASWCIQEKDICEREIAAFAGDADGSVRGLEQSGLEFDEIGALSPARWVSVEVCHSSSTTGRRVDVSPIGRLRVEEHSCVS